MKLENTTNFHLILANKNNELLKSTTINDKPIPVNH